jgi:hypothetical protein
MAFVTLTTLWASPVSDPSQAYALPMSSLSWTTTTTGDVRSYGGGRRRLITRKEKYRTADIALDFCDRPMVELLESWTGVLLCFRDPTGRKIFGFYLDVTADEFDGDDGASVSFSITEVTHSEEV